MKSFTNFEQLDEVNHRDFASQGKMHPDMAKHMKVGQSMDFYHSKTGDKISGTVTKNDGKSVHVKADKDGHVAKGDTHKFKVSRSIDEANEGSWKVETPWHKVKGDGTVTDKSGAKHTPMSQTRDLARKALQKTLKKANEEVELEEAAESGNKGYGYHGQHESDVADKKYSAAHTTVKKVAGAAGHLKDAKKPNEMVKHYLDSRHGRHLAGNEKDHEYIKKDFGKFKKDYKPELHESYGELGEELYTELYEVLAKDAKASDYISDFVKSDDPKFAGDSKKQRIKRALGAYYAQQKEEVELEEGTTPYYNKPSWIKKMSAAAKKERLAREKKEQEAKPVKEGYDDNRTGFGKRPREDDEYHVPDPEVSKTDKKKKKTLREFTLDLLEYESKDGRYVHTKGSYGKSYQDDGDDEDDKPAAKKPAGEKRGRGRPAGSKSGARQQNTGKSYGGIATHSLNLPNSNK